MSKLMEMIKAKKRAIVAQSGRHEKTHKPQNGKGRYRILPGWDKENPAFYRDFGQHFIKNEKDEVVAVYVCSDKTNGKPCSLCDAVFGAIRDTSDDDTLKVLGEAKSKGRILLNALHLDGEDPLAPVILDLTPTTFEQILNIMEEYGEEMLDLEKGVDLVIERTGKGLNTEYKILPAAKSNPVDKAVLARLNNLDEYVAQEYEAGEAKALAALGGVSGKTPMLTAGASKALGGPKEKPTTATSKTIDVDYSTVAVDDEIPFIADDEPVTPPPATKVATPATDDFGAAMSDDDVEALLADL